MEIELGSFLHIVPIVRTGNFCKSYKGRIGKLLLRTGKFCSSGAPSGWKKDWGTKCLGSTQRAWLTDVGWVPILRGLLHIHELTF